MQTLSLGDGDVDYMIPELDPNFLGDGLGISDDELRSIGESLSKRSLLSASDMASVLEGFAEEQQQTIIASFLLFGGDASIVSRASELARRSRQPKGSGKKNCHLPGRNREHGRERLPWLPPQPKPRLGGVVGLLGRRHARFRASDRGRAGFRQTQTMTRSVPLWPYGPPDHHEECCLLHETGGNGYCDCKASDASDTEWGIGAWCNPDAVQPDDGR